MLLLLKSVSGGSVTAFTNLTGGGVASSTSTTTASVSPTADCLVLVTVHAYISTGSVQPATPSVTGNGITYTLVKAQDVDTAGTDRATMWVFRGMSASPTSGAITISFGAVSQTRIQWAVDQSTADVNTSGTNGAGAVVQSTGVTLGSAATLASVNYATTMRSTSAGYSAWGHQVQEAKTPRSGWTELADVNTVSLASVETQYIAGTDTAGSSSWATSSRAGGIILEIAPAPVLLASYNYGEASGDVVDQSGNSRAFTLTTASRTSAGGGYTYSGAQPNVKAISQGTSGQVQQGPSITGLNTPARTVMSWVKGAGLNDPGWFLMHHKTTGDTGTYGYLELSGSFSGRAKDSGGSPVDITATPDSANWHHWALVADGKVLRLYKDGTQVGSDTALTSIQDADDYRIFDNGGSGTFVSETRIYDGALSTAQISTDMATPIAGGGGFTGTITATQADQTSTASGQLGYTGTAAVTQAANTSAASGQLGYSGTGSATQAAQTSNAGGQLGYTGTASASQAAQTASASGTFTAGGSFAGSAAVTQANQTGAASGQLGYSGTAAPSQANNTSAASGTVVNPVTGTASPVQANQFSIANGILRYTGTAAVVEAADIATATGVVSGPITGTAAVVQANQTVVAVGTFTALVSFGTASAATGQAPAASAAAVATPSANAGSAVLASASSGSSSAPAASSGAMTVPTATGG